MDVDHPLFLITKQGKWIKLYPNMDSFEEAYQIYQDGQGDRLWYNGAYYSWSCGFCPRGLTRLLNIFETSSCNPQDCVNLWKSCFKDQEKL